MTGSTTASKLSLTERMARRRPHDAPVQHSGHAEIVHISELAGDLIRDIDPRDRRADDLEGSCILGRQRLSEKALPAISSP
jgi:hypothetical protein